MKSFAKGIAILFHPLVLFFLLILYGYSIDQYGYRIESMTQKQVMLFMAFFITILFPLVGVLMLRGLKLIQSFSMKGRQERIGPLIITSIFYIWFFINVYNSALYPKSLVFISLVGAIGITLAFFINNFSKISLHTLGAGSLLASLFILSFTVEKPYLDIHSTVLGSFRVSAIFVILLAILIAGLTGMSRLVLGAHKSIEVYGGYLVGVFSAVLSYLILS